MKGASTEKLPFKPTSCFKVLFALKIGEFLRFKRVLRRRFGHFWLLKHECEVLRYCANPPVEPLARLDRKANIQLRVGSCVAGTTVRKNRKHATQPADLPAEGRALLPTFFPP